MPTSNIVSSTRYIDVGVTKVYFLPAIAATTLVPTRAEMNSGTNLSTELADWSGWVLDAELLDVQPINSRFRSKIPGSLESPDSSLTLYTSKTGVDARNVLSPSTTGFIMFLDGGDIAGNRAEVWPVTIATASVLRGTVDTDSANSSGASRILVKCAITAAPAQNVTVPA